MIDWRQTRREMGLGFVVWGAVALLFYVRSYINYATAIDPKITWDQVWLRAAIESSIDVLVWTLFTPLIFGVSRRFPLRPGRLPSSLVVHLAVAAVLCSASTLINFGVATFTFITGPFWPRYFFIGLPNNVLAYGCTVAGCYAVEYYRGFRDRELRASQLETQLARAHLRALEMQIHPHFLFNTLNSISELVHSDPRAAEQMIARLGDLLRMTVDGAGRQEVTLEREMAFLGAYLDIERTRFQDRLSVKVEIQPEAAQALMPTLLLQPLVENAIRHGLAPTARPGTLTITGRVHEGWLRLEVRDDGLGLPPPEQRRERVGIGNTRTRLRQLYCDAHRFEVGPAPGGGTRVVVEIPYIPSDEQPEPPRRRPLAGVAA
ncbi:MAG TPA: histidine kinase [Longimicrobium sp.]|nr:histidine kinase [Longimicrobium sp.]